MSLRLLSKCPCICASLPCTFRTSFWCLSMLYQQAVVLERPCCKHTCEFASEFTCAFACEFACEFPCEFPCEYTVPQANVAVLHIFCLDISESASHCSYSSIELHISLSIWEMAQRLIPKQCQQIISIII